MPRKTVRKEDDAFAVVVVQRFACELEHQAAKADGGVAMIECFSRNIRLLELFHHAHVFAREEMGSIFDRAWILRCAGQKAGANELREDPCVSE